MCLVCRGPNSQHVSPGAEGGGGGTHLEKGTNCVPTAAEQWLSRTNISPVIINAHWELVEFSHVITTVSVCIQSCSENCLKQQLFIKITFTKLIDPSISDDLKGQCLGFHEKRGL